MRKFLVFATVAMLGGAAIAATAAATPSPAGADAIAVRKAAFKMSAVAFGTVKGAFERGADVKTLGFATSSIAGWAHTLPVAFPKGSEGAPSEALPNVWSDRAGFAKAAAAYATAADKLVAASKAGDKDGFAAALTETGAACGACHKVYKKPEPPRA
jgi:cytochrome c556